MKLLHVSHAIPPEANTGVENYTVHLARAQQASGHEVAVYARGLRSDVPAGSEEREVGPDGYLAVRVHLGPGHHHGHTRFRSAEAERFGRFVRQWRPDVVHFQHLLYHSLDYPEIAARYGAATLMTLHDFWFSCPKVQRIDFRGEVCYRAPGQVCLPCLQGGRKAKIVSPELLSRLAENPLSAKLLDLVPTGRRVARWREESQRCFDFLDLVISPSRFLADNILANGLRPRRLVISDYGIPRPGDPPAGLLLGPDGAGGVRFGVIGTHRLKGLHVAVEAFRALQSDDLPASLRIYGALEESLRPDLPPNCEARGRYTASELERVFGEFDVLIVPSIWFENAPFVIREAFARGKPVIASDLGGMAESVRDGQDGLLFAMGDPAALAACVRRIVREPDLLPRLRQGIRPPKFFEAHLAELAALYQELHASAAGRAAAGNGRAPFPASAKDVL